MSVARGRDFFPQLALTPEHTSYQEHFCERPGCDRPASWGFRQPGFEGLRQPCHWFCFTHRDDGRAFLRSAVSASSERAA
jgi:hypothetical protein